MLIYVEYVFDGTVMIEGPAMTGKRIKSKGKHLFGAKKTNPDKNQELRLHYQTKQGSIVLEGGI